MDALTAPSLYTALGLLDALLDGRGDLNDRARLEEAADWFSDHFSADEHDLAAVELSAFMEAMP